MVRRFVDLAVNVDGSGVAAFNFSAGARVTFMDVEHHGGEWRNDLLLGSSNLAATEFYQPIANSHLFVAPYAFASKLPRNSFEGQTRVAVFGDERAGGGFDLGYDSGRRSELRFGYQIFSGKLAPLIGSAGLPVLSGSTGEFRTRYVWDGQDSPAIPGAGTRIVASLARVLQSPGLVHPIGSTRRADLHLHSHQRKDLAILRRRGRNDVSWNCQPVSNLFARWIIPPWRVLAQRVRRQRLWICLVRIPPRTLSSAATRGEEGLLGRMV